MNDKGETRDDLRIPEGELGQKIRDEFGKEDITVIVSLCFVAIFNFMDLRQAFSCYLWMSVCSDDLNLNLYYNTNCSSKFSNHYIFCIISIIFKFLAGSLFCMILALYLFASLVGGKKVEPFLKEILSC